jgi:biopolymer transport protein ExbD
MKLGKIELGFTGPNMIPMIDIVFQLVMFFMIAITFENSKADERVKLPLDVLAIPREVKPEHELVLNFGFQLDKHGHKINSVPTVFYNDRDFEVGELTRVLDAEKRALEETQGRDVIEKVTVKIRTDSEVANGLVQQLIKKCQDSGFTKVTVVDRGRKGLE